jgi:hypothetical protein
MHRGRGFYREAKPHSQGQLYAVKETNHGPPGFGSGAGFLLLYCDSLLLYQFLDTYPDRRRDLECDRRPIQGIEIAARLGVIVVAMMPFVT